MKKKFIVDVEKLSRFLLLNGYNKTSFCRACNISDQSLRNIYRYEVVSPTIAKKISTTLNVEITDIFSIS